MPRLYRLAPRLTGVLVMLLLIGLWAATMVIEGHLALEIAGLELKARLHEDGAVLFSFAATP